MSFKSYIQENLYLTAVQFGIRRIGIHIFLHGNQARNNKPYGYDAG